ncbi:MAG: hypothetical protein WCV59_01140 [Parcubacteria group bacterium]|jgi:hypothetical protein
MPPITWTLEKIKEGFDKFYNLYDRYPAAYDIDDFDFLPSSRQIQRKFGGLISLRKDLGLEINNYMHGKVRSNKISEFLNKGKYYENIAYKLLIEKFGEKFVHVEKPTYKRGDLHEYNSKDRYDFYVYAKPTNFAIDVFGTSDSRGVVNIMNIKEKKYRKINSKENLYFIYFGNNIKDEKVQSWLEKRKNKFPTNWKILSFKNFKLERISKIYIFQGYLALRRQASIPPVS